MNELRYLNGVKTVKSNRFKAFILSFIILLTSVSVQGMGFYEPDPKAVTTDEKINDYLFYLAKHGLPAVVQSGFDKAVPALFERVVVDGARAFVPDVLGAKTAAQKKLVHIGIDGVRQTIQMSSQIKQYAQQQGQKIKRTDAMRLAFAKIFVPNFTKAMATNLLYTGGARAAHAVMNHFGYKPETLAASQFTLTGMLYQQARQMGYRACQTLFETLFGY